jgi:hypothetical protein
MRWISYRHPDRDFALAVLARLHEAADGHLRARAGRQAEAQLVYLREALAKETVLEERRPLLDRIRDVERVRMVVDIDLPFAAEAIDRPSAAALADWPRPERIVGWASAVGLVIGILLVHAIAWWKASPAPPPPRYVPLPLREEVLVP